MAKLHVRDLMTDEVFTLDAQDELTKLFDLMTTENIRHVPIATLDLVLTLLPLVLPGFTDSHWFRKAFPKCVAYGFFPQRAMSFFDTAPLIHAPDERVATDDLDFASRFYRELAIDLLA